MEFFKPKLPLSKEIWTFLGLTSISLLVVFKFANLVPQIDQNFFFSSHDPQFKSEKRISELFKRNDTQLVISATGPIRSKKYKNNIEKLTRGLKEIAGVTSVKSITNGPRNLKDALKSPLWKRLLIADDQRSSNIVVLFDEARSEEIVKQAERVIQENTADNFKLCMSGVPFVVELISRYLLRDLRTFSLLAFIIFGILIFIIFRSKLILTGTMISCLNACLWTLMVTELMQIPIGLLTANLVTIIVVLTLSHVVFLTFNWRKLSRLEKRNCVDGAVAHTFEASFWSMVTTSMGFLSLLFVPAKPLRELGLAGAVGSLAAIVAAYGVYPVFLKLAKIKEYQNIARYSAGRIYAWLEKNKHDIRFTMIFFCLIAVPGFWKLNTDPGLLSFFSSTSEIYTGLEYIDQNGGSSPLILVVKAEDGGALDNADAYAKLWNLQEALEGHRSVGSVISLPVLMAEAKQEPLAFFLFWDWLLDILEKPQYDAIAKSFVTEDRKYGLFLLRMNELNRVKKRLTIMGELNEVVEAQGFSLEITGGVYKLQGHMAHMVTRSLISGLVELMGLFFIIAWIVARSFKITLAMIFSLVLIPCGILGAIGLYGIPLDVISSPASNVAMALGIDSMIHLVQAYRRKKKNNPAPDREIWQSVRDDLWRPVLTSMIVVSTGFAIFLFSTFPPTQRFGGAIVFGTLISGLTALYIMPLLARK